MAKLFGVDEIELKPGVTEEEFESFLKEETTLEWVSDLHSVGWYPHIVKGVAGDRDGKYLLLMEVESVETRDRFYADEISEDIKQWFETHPSVGKFWEKFGTLTTKEGVHETNYVELD